MQNQANQGPPDRPGPISERLVIIGHHKVTLLRGGGLEYAVHSVLRIALPWGDGEIR